MTSSSIQFFRVSFLFVFIIRKITQLKLKCQRIVLLQCGLDQIQHVRLNNFVLFSLYVSFQGTVFSLDSIDTKCYTKYRIETFDQLDIQARFLF